MLEGLAAWILNTYVGEYLENLNTDQLSIGLLQGEVELENLPLRKDALKALELPVQIHSGFVGKIKLQIPVSRLRSEPWVIFIERLFLIAGPILSSEYDEKVEEAAALSRKLAQLEALEAKAKLKIKNVHIRYEDGGSCHDHKFACGILIHSLSAQSTDQNWLPKFVRRDDNDFMWKLLELQGLSLYWDTSSGTLSNLDSKEMMAAMGKHFDSPSSTTHEYILAPVNADAHLTRNCSSKPLRSRFTPRIICDINLQKIPLSLSEVQYRQMMECVKAFEVLDVRWKHRKWRPNIPLKNNARKWWTYAIAVHLEPLQKQNKACTWSFVLERAHDINSYSKVYQEYLSKPDLSPDSKALKDELEQKLSFELLLILRELVAKKIEKSNSIEINDEQSKGKGFLQWMFPSWGGWYSDSSIPADTVDGTKSDQPDVEELKSHLEEEILDVLDSAENESLLKRDTVFAQLNFSLSQGTFSLLQSESLATSPTGRNFPQQGKSIIDLEFSDVSTKLETRPRNGSFLFEIKLGALYLHDRIYSDSHFPHIIAPQNRDVSFMYTKSSSITVFPLPSFLNQKSEETDVGNYLFELSYEKKPFTIHADHRLHITTRALDVVYNPQVLRCVTDFFSLHHGKSPTDFSVSELRLTAAARARYETLKQQTKAELQQKWDEILDGEDKTVYSRGWNVELAISAPQIIIPEDICDKDSSVVVFDLGKLHFFNARTEEIDKTTPSSEDLDDDENFITPCSTPQELIERAKRANELMEMMSSQKDAQILKEHIYEKYTLELSNIQILVSRLRDNWRFAQLRGTSTMHILDRFSITVQTERRMVYTQDPEWPCIAVTGNLPKLIVHVSEQKVNALQTCFDVLNSPIMYKPVRSSSQFYSHEGSFDLVEQFNEKSSKEKKRLISKQISEGHADLNESSLLLLMEFCIDQMSFDVQSRGHSVAELQVTGVKSTFSKHPHNVSLSLCVHSLLLVDALQTYGPDFELLLASHKHLSMDSTSGSLRDSEPNSPASPASPDPISSPLIGKSAPTPPAALSAALSTLKTSKISNPSKKWSSSLTVPKTEQYASDALITLEFNWVEMPSSEIDCSEVLQIGNVQFNNLDVIANQETIVELVDFVKRIALERTRKSANGKLSPVEGLNRSINEKEETSSKYISRTEITFDFHRLNILLLRAVSQKHSSLGQKVATATISGARIQATIGTVIEIQGSLGGLQVLDLITENTKHQKIISIGYDPLTVQPVDLLNMLEEGMYKPLNQNTPSEPHYALTFSIIRGDKTDAHDTTDSHAEDSNRQQGYLDINLRMASLCYTHSPRLLYELSSCATEFKAYMSSLASSIKSAAAEVAKGIVSKRTGSISATLHGNNPDTLTSRSRFESTDDITDDVVFINAEPDDVTVELKLDVLLQTPVVAFPTSPQSTQVLVAHLGRIAIQKGESELVNNQQLTLNIADLNKENTVLIEVRDMNMHFVDVEQKAQVSANLKNAPDALVLPNLSTKELYACEDKTQLIIHDTVLEIVFNSHKSNIASEMVPSILDANSVHYELNSDPNHIEIRGKVVNPLRVVLVKHQFRQIMKVLDNLTYVKDTNSLYGTRSSTFADTLETCDELSPLNIKPDTSQTTSKLQNSITVTFELPDLITELRDDLTDREEGIVSITFQEFLLEYHMEKMYEATLQVTLQTLLMEDLRNSEVSPHCYLMSSVNQTKSTNTYPTLPKSNFISTSCPSLSDANLVMCDISSVSLPDRLCTPNMFSLNSGRKLSGTNSIRRSQSKTEADYPTTPPPSPTGSNDIKNHSADALVSINVTLIDKKSPHFTKKYNKISHFIDIDFNSLDIVLNLQTWVMVIDFFSSGGDEIEEMVLDRSNSNIKNSFYGERKTENDFAKESSNSEIRLKVKSLTVVLNKPEYKLASANISNYISDMSFRESNYTIKGTLGSISVSDLSPHGYLYPEKFITTGSEALHFNVFKYSNSTPNVQTEFDMSVKCQMSSVQYVHTQRFLTEITTFFRHFNEMQELIRRIRLAASGAVVDPENSRGSRIKLDISAGSPVIAIPQSASLTDVLVADLGQITVCNTFLFYGSEGTISYCGKEDDSKPPPEKKLKRTKSKDFSERSKVLFNQTECLLDVINVELTDMDLYSAIHLPKEKSHKRKNIASPSDSKDLIFPSFIIRKQGNDLLQQKFMLQVQVERNLDSATSHLAPDWAVEGVVSSVYVTLDKKQYKLIFGILNQNLGEPLEEFSFDPNTESEQFVIMDTDEKAWTTMAIHMDLVNVSLELIRNDGIVNKPGECSLAKFDFIKSRLSFEAYSDNSRDIDLVSNMIQVLDIRYKDAPVNNRPNVFTKVLQPTNISDNNGSTLQAEIHYRITKDFTRFTVLLNNMRIMGVFEFLRSVLNFLTVPSCGTPQKEISELQQKESLSNKNLTKAQTNFEMKFNVTDSEFVVVEDTSMWDSNAVILKSTAVITWKPDYLEKPLSCSLQNLEVFSCILGVEDDTALSIIDPLSVSIEILSKANSPIIELEFSEVQHVLEISAVNLNIRLSYYDITMFLKIFDSIKRQMAFYSKAIKVPSLPNSKINSANIDCLIGLGFTASDCQNALEICKGNINDAAIWLTQHAAPVVEISNNAIKQNEPVEERKKLINVVWAEVRLTSFSLSIIDDCRDADVPVVELNLMEVQFVQKFLSSPEGYGNFGFSADYYNRALSGWEPVIEPWKCSVKWKMQPIQSKDGKKVMLNIASPDAINFNVTSSLIELFKTVKKNWTEDYLNINNRNKETVETSSPGCYKRRLPFMPFALKNDTGCKVWFATQITSAKQQSLDLGNDNMPAQNSKFSLVWTEVPAGNLVPVPFENRSKIRHKDSHSMKLHQIIVRAEGWHPAAPVSVDRVGTYFRHAAPQKSHSASAYSERSPARIVFVVALEGSARKLITVQSSLLVSNGLDDAIELKLENSGLQYGVKSLSMYLVPQQTLPVPLHFVYAQIWARPMDKFVAFCKYSINWNDVAKPGEIHGNIKQCSSIQKTSEFYKFLVLVRRRNFPLEKEVNVSPNSIHNRIHPAHRIYFIPCLEIINLLPYELHYYLKDTNFSGFVKPGKRKCIHSIDVSDQFYVKFFLENFKQCKEVPLSSSSRHFPTRIELRDNQDRILILQLKVQYLPGGGLKLFITAPFWIVNRTGLPLVFKQEGTHIEAAGQFEEHELARCMAPLLFSFPDHDSSTMCNMRVGRSLHIDGIPQWCMRFTLEKGIRVRRLHVLRKDSRPDLVYNIGIDVRVGKGRYGDTHIVTLSPRYYLDNSTSHKLEFCQLFATKDNRQYILSAMSNSSLPFHWPRIDLDNLLCVRQPDIEGCNWSGGFPIDNIQSFHINMRDSEGKSNFLRVEIILQGATFFIVFTDTDRLPPPFRIDNHSEVSITYYQTNVDQERLKTAIRAHTSIPYAFDEPTLSPYITLCAPGGSAATYNMNIFREGSQLFYENFIYIIFSGTFLNDNGGTSGVPPNLAGREYVLDVPYNNKVVINKREVGKRSQLWRMTSTGMLQHEGSSPPRDPHKSNSSNNAKVLVLDIADIGPQPNEFTCLILRKPDPRRQHTQTWKFTSDGRLCCGYPNMYVQSKDGFKGLRRGNNVVLGPAMPVSFVTLDNGIPIEQAISRRKLRGGSGVLTVKVIPDGPTRVLQITDIKKKQIVSHTSPSSDWVVVEENNLCKTSNADSSEDPNQQCNNDIEMQISLQLPKGLGISLINNFCEELVYIWLHNIVVEYNKASTYHTLGGSIKDIQVDNQLRDAEKPVMLYVTEQNISDGQRHLPALHFTVQRICTPVINAEIFKHLIVTLKNLTIHLEEKHLLKLIQFAGFDQTESEGEKTDESENNQTQKNITKSMAYEKRYYFSTLKLCLQQIKLSVLTSSNLPFDLLMVKKKMRLTLIKFEDATIELDAFLRVYPFETANFLIDSIIDHYKEELKGEAVKILGAVDFLGNPLGLMNDVSDGISKLIHEGSVGGLIKNVTHGISDSAAKLTSSMSDGLGVVAMDDKHQRIRKQIRQQSSARGNDHLMAGLKGLGFGLIGGVTSVFTQTYEGAVQEGVQGFFSGLGKGIVGTVAKPAVGFLDFASGAASAMRDTSKGSSHAILVRTRPPRVCVGSGGLVPRYSFQQALGQEFLYNLNSRDFSELFIAKEQIRSGTEDLHALISNEQVYFLCSGMPSTSNVVLTVPFTDLYKCSYVYSDAGVIGEVRHYLQLIMKADNATGSITVSNDPAGRRHSRSTSMEPLCKKPQVRCDSEEVAQKVAMQINYAKSLHEERTYMVIEDEDSDEEKE
ncbi:vacuolar protein sorting-associated protein 13D [Trichonephila clavata]|uniref:Vacuolar protein sorting-associated protein 13D n=1 Tax=Trichonephila clavata TaxID=2740835 RepID=A0A8X6KV40_TRICU|nr:vacuolar protein sorting-associated protein 13D [Trichonephila clavata]